MSPERRYRMLLLAYPRSYRAERAEEMLQVLLLAAEERPSAWSAWSEGASLVRHGLAQRARQQVMPDATSRGLAGASLLCVLAVLGARQLLASGLRGLGWDGYPDQWQASVLWVDPRWPVHVVWLVTGLVLMLGRHRLAVVSAWAAVVVHAWQASSADRARPSCSQPPSSGSDSSGRRTAPAPWRCSPPWRRCR